MATSALVHANNIDIPGHISVDFFKRALEKGLDVENVRIREIEFAMGSSGGENYCSDIYRAIVKYSTESGSDEVLEIPLIVKNMQFDGERLVLQEMQVYDKELCVYQKVLPEMGRLLGRVIVPRCHYAETNPPLNTIVFDDIKALGFELGDRVKGLDKAHCEVVMKKIGQYHALSKSVIKKNPQLKEVFHTSVFDLGESQIKEEIFKKNLSYIADLIKSWEGFEDIAAKLRVIRENFDAITAKWVPRRDDEFCVLNHGDLWVNNFMFKYDGEQPVDLALIDFQISYYASPGIDLNYFLNTSAQLDVLRNHREELIRVYYDAFATTLKSTKYTPIPSFDDINREVKISEFYGFWAMEAVFPMISMSKELSQDNTLDKFADADSAQRKRLAMFGTQRVQDALRYSLKRFDELGVLG